MYFQDQPATVTRTFFREKVGFLTLEFPAAPGPKSKPGKIEFRCFGDALKEAREVKEGSEVLISGVIKTGKKYQSDEFELQATLEAISVVPF